MRLVSTFEVVNHLLSTLLLVGATDLAERFFNRIKHFRRVSTRHNKLADSYLTFVSLACAFAPFVGMT